MKFLQRCMPKTPDNQDVLVINQLYDLLQNHGDNILSGCSKLSLTAPILSLLNDLFLKLTRGTNQPEFQDLHSKENKILFIFDFFQKVRSLKLLPGVVNSSYPPLDICHFKLVEVLEIHKIPISSIKNLSLIRRQLKSLTCFKTADTIHNVICQFGSTKELLQIPFLTELDLSCNKITNINDDAMKYLPSLEKLNLSYNNLQIANSEELSTLSHLDLSFNTIISIPIFSEKVSEKLTHLYLKNNQLSSLKGVQCFIFLKELDVSFNCLLEFNELEHISYLEKLVTVSLKGNPISFDARYRATVIGNLSPVRRRCLICLDGIKLDLDELSTLGKDVKPKPLLLPCFPEALSNIQSSNKSCKVRHASIKDSNTSLSKIHGSFDRVSTLSSTSAKSKEEEKQKLKAAISSRKYSSSNSVIWDTNIVVLNNKEPKNEYVTQCIDTETSEDLSSSKLIEDVINRNEPMMSLSATEMHLNKQEENTDELNCLPFDFNDRENAECESEFAYLVKKKLFTPETDLTPDVDSTENLEYLFIYFHQFYLIEKSDNGTFRNRLDLNYLSKVDSNPETLTAKMTFDLFRVDWKYREYVFEHIDHLDAFVMHVNPFVARNCQKKISDMIHCVCLKCGAAFLTKTNKSNNCNECGSSMIIEVDNNEKRESKYSQRNDENNLNSNSATDCAVINYNATAEHRTYHFNLSQSLPCCKQLEEKNFVTLRHATSYPSLSNKNNNNEFNNQTNTAFLSQEALIEKKLSEPRFISTTEQDSLYIDNIFRCDHRLKLFLSINVYRHEEEEFVCQLQCECVLNTKSEMFDCFFNVSSTSIYVFAILDKTSLSPEQSLKKFVSCDIPKVMLVAPCYNYQGFVVELAKPSLRLKFLTGDSRKTFNLLATLEVEFSKFSSTTIYSPVHHPRTAANIRLQIFGLAESLLEKADRLYTQLSLYSMPKLLQSRKYHLRMHYNCFIASEFLDWLCLHKEAPSRKEALFLCNQLLHDGHIIHISKQTVFKDDSEWYQFTQFTDESSNSMQPSKSDGDLFGDSSWISDGINEDVKIYMFADVALNSEDFTLLRQTVVGTLSHIFVVKECHVWPLPRTFLPTAVTNDQFVKKASMRITDIVSLELYDDSACQLSIKFIDEDNEECSWFIYSMSAFECNNLVKFIKTRWQQLFAIDLTCYNQPTFIDI
ncbi:uncharacterized protein LOC101234890 isoform X4 [Hydra vulgaris]|uniref:Serine/threonine-protein kinase 11-interacting protein n=1 Tax=Hydra vulgaris TaxID=6087 RepID=A0ABM4CSX9_HYDVU